MGPAVVYLLSLTVTGTPPWGLSRLPAYADCETTVTSWPVSVTGVATTSMLAVNDPLSEQ